jgi:hypothetical protein
MQQWLNGFSMYLGCDVLLLLVLGHFDCYATASHNFACFNTDKHLQLIAILFFIRIVILIISYYFYC